MTILKTPAARTFLFAAGLAIASAATAADAPDARVQVSWTDPADFSETSLYPGSAIGRESPDEWLGNLAAQGASPGGDASGSGMASPTTRYSRGASCARATEAVEAKG